MTSLFSLGRNRRNNREQGDFTETSLLAVSDTAYVIRDVEPGKVGRLHYRATDWNARALDNTCISAGTPVVLVRRQGNTWFVSKTQTNSPEFSRIEEVY